MKDDLKTITIAAVGTGVSYSLAQVLPWVSLAAAVLTIIYTGMKIVHLAQNWRAKPKED